MQKFNINDNSLITFFFMNDTERNGRRARNQYTNALTRLPENDDIHGGYTGGDKYLPGWSGRVEKLQRYN